MMLAKSQSLDTGTRVAIPNTQRKRILGDVATLYVK